MRRFSPLLLSLMVLSVGASAFGESLCDWALRKSNALESRLHPKIELSLTPWVEESFRSRGISEQDLEVLIQKSEVNSYVKDGKVILPIFYTEHSPTVYRDYVYELELRAPFFAGRPGKVQVLNAFKVSEREQKTIFAEIVSQKRIKPVRLKLRHRLSDTQKFGFVPGPIFVKITPGVLAKLRFKHRIDSNLLSVVLEKFPDEVVASPRKAGSVEVYYHSDDISLIMVLARDEKINTTSLVTSYFLRRVLH